MFKILHHHLGEEIRKEELKFWQLPQAKVCRKYMGEEGRRGHARGAICSPCTALAKKQQAYHEYCVINLSSENATHLAQDLKFPTI